MTKSEVKLHLQEGCDLLLFITLTTASKWDFSISEFISEFLNPYSGKIGGGWMVGLYNLGDLFHAW